MPFTLGLSFSEAVTQENVRAVTMEKSPIYSPKQVLAGSALGGPIALVYFVRANFLTLSNRPAAGQTMIWGVLFNLVVIAAMPFVPRNFPRYLLPLAYSWTAWGVAEAKQLKKENIAVSSQFRFQSNWRVFGLGIAFLVGTFALYCAIFVLLSALHVINLP